MCGDAIHDFPTVSECMLLSSPKETCGEFLSEQRDSCREQSGKSGKREYKFKWRDSVAGDGGGVDITMHLRQRTPHQSVSRGHTSLHYPLCQTLGTPRQASTIKSTARSVQLSRNFDEIPLLLPTSYSCNSYIIRYQKSSSHTSCSRREANEQIEQLCYYRTLFNPPAATRYVRAPVTLAWLPKVLRMIKTFLTRQKLLMGPNCLGLPLFAYPHAGQPVPDKARVPTSVSQEGCSSLSMQIHHTF